MQQTSLSPVLCLLCCRRGCALTRSRRFCVATECRTVHPAGDTTCCRPDDSGTETSSTTCRRGAGADKSRYSANLTDKSRYYHPSAGDPEFVITKPVWANQGFSYYMASESRPPLRRYKPDTMPKIMVKLYPIYFADSCPSLAGSILEDRIQC